MLKPNNKKAFPVAKKISKDGKNFAQTKPTTSKFGTDMRGNKSGKPFDRERG